LIVKEAARMRDEELEVLNKKRDNLIRRKNQLESLDIVEEILNATVK